MRRELASGIWREWASAVNVAGAGIMRLAGVAQVMNLAEAGAHGEFGWNRRHEFGFRIRQENWQGDIVIHGA